jgi:hypothetical protein
MAIDTTGNTLSSTDVVTELIFLQREEKHNTEKPYKHQYNPGDGLPRTNCENEVINGIVIHDMRGREHEFTLEREGFTVRRLESKMARADFFDEAKVKEIYYEELKEMVSRAIPEAKGVEVLEHGARSLTPCDHDAS